MKSRGFDLSIGRATSVLKFIILSSLVVLFLHVSFSLYTSVSTRDNYSIKQPILRIVSSSSSSSSSSPLPIYQWKSNILQGSSSPTPTNPSPNSNNSVTSLLLLLLLQSPPPPKLNQSSISSPLPSTFPSLNTIDRSHPLSASINNLNDSSVDPYESSLPTLIIQNSTSSNLNSSSSPNYKLNSSATISLNTETEIARKRLLPKGCDLSKGEWVRDPNAPYYTNSTCWMIQEHQNCIKYGRPNLDFLKWRWRPNGCELPLLDPVQFLELMRGKALAFIGDSLARNQMQSLMCLLSRVQHPKEISSADENPIRMFYESYSFTISFFWSPFLVRAEQSNHTVHNFPSWNLYLDEPDPLWPPHLPKFDFVVLNTGNWYTRPALFHLNRILVGCHYCPVPNAPFASIRRAHRRAFRTALNSVAGAAQHGFRGMAVVRTVSPSHFEGGEWNRGGDCGRTEPFRGEEAPPRLEGLEKEMYEEQLKEFWKAKWEGSEVGLEFRLLDSSRAMVMRPDGHPSKYGRSPEEMPAVMYNDCVHWCLPGPVDMWNDFLFQIINI